MTEIYTDETGPLHSKGYDYFTEIPIQESIKRLMPHQRSKTRGSRVEPNKSQDIILIFALKTEQCLRFTSKRPLNINDYHPADDGMKNDIIFNAGKERECLKFFSSAVFLFFFNG